MSTLMANSTAYAINFNAFDPKSIAMGGAGVAIADPATAPFFNPALLSIAEKDDDFSIEFPVFGIRVSDQNDFIDKVDGTDTLRQNVDNAIAQFNQSNSFNTSAMTTAIEALDDKISSLSDSPLAGSGGFGIVIAIPSENFGIALSISGSGEGVGVFNYADSPTVTGFTRDMTIISNCIGGGSVDATAVNCILNGDGSQANPSGVQTVTVNTNLAQDDIDVEFSTDTDLQSEAQFVGVAVGEVGFSISREFFIGNSNWSFGITPKALTISIIDYRANVSTVEDAVDDVAEITTDYEDFNIDFGVAKDFENGWRAGVAIKNLISQEYESKVANRVVNFVKIEPQIRAGVSHQTDWTTVAFDLDITENESLAVFNDSSTQYAALGAELNVWDVTQLRFGYRTDLVNSGRDVFSAGIGFSPLGVHLDLGIAIGENDNEGAIAFQFGFRI